MIVVNTETVVGYDIVEVKGIVQGNTVRAKHVGRDIAASLKNIVGGELRGYTDLLTESRREAMERMVAELLEHETVDRDRVDEIFHDVPKWEHAPDGAMRIRYPDNPVFPRERKEEEQIAAAEEAEQDEPVTESLKLERKIPGRARPAEA